MASVRGNTLASAQRPGGYSTRAGARTALPPVMTQGRWSATSVEEQPRSLLLGMPRVIARAGTIPDAGATVRRPRGRGWCGRPWPGPCARTPECASSRSPSRSPRSPRCGWCRPADSSWATVEEWLPEFADRLVLSHPPAALADPVPARRAITVRHRLTEHPAMGWRASALAVRSPHPCMEDDTDSCGWGMPGRET